MAEDDMWGVTNLIDPEEPFVEEVTLARQMLQTLNNLNTLDSQPQSNSPFHPGNSFDLNVRTPRAALEFIENTLSEWFETVAEIEKRKGNMPYLVDRSLYSASTDDADIISWNHHLKRDDLLKWFKNKDFQDNFLHEYLFMKIRHVSEDPISGYINRIFPVKYVLRVFASMTLSEFYDDMENRFDGEGAVKLEELRDCAHNTALYARDWLSNLDKESGPNLGAEVSVGFPENTEKAKERFVAQFVGSKRKNNVSGAIFDMGFASLTGFTLGPIKHTSSEVFFSEAGWKFAMLPNPLMDSMEGWKEYFETGRRFSDEEIEFLLEHFKNNTPAEWKLLSTIANLIDSGSNRPKTLEDRLIDSYEWDKTKASQMRNGALSRMEELCLIVREKKGREVTYSLTDLCRDTVLAN